MSVLTELSKLVQDELVQAVISVIVDTDEVFKLLPFRQVKGAGLTVTWEDSLPEATFVAPDGTIPQSSGRTLRQFTETVKVIARDIDIPNYAREVMGADIGAIIEGEIKAMGRLYKKAMYTGDESKDPNSFNGLLKRVDEIEDLGIERTVDAGANLYTMRMRIVNCTPHKVVVVVGEEKVEVAPSGVLVRVETEETNAGTIQIDGKEIPLVKNTFKGLTFTKNGEKMTEDQVREFLQNANALIVPLLLKDWKSEIQKIAGKELLLLAPNTAKAIRNQEGQIVGVPSLVVL